MKKRNRSLCIFFYTASIFIVLLTIYSFLVEPNLISIHTVPIASNELYVLFAGKKVVHISDLHITSIGYREIKLITMLNRINPDILFITGDFLTNGKDEQSCIALLQQIRRPPYGIWAVLGNSDRYKSNDPNEGISKFAKSLESLNIRVLENTCQRLVLNDNGDHLFIGGIQGRYLSRLKLSWLLKDIPDDSSVILLSHYPDILEEYADALAINLEEAEGAGVSGWDWQDNAFFDYDTGIVRFAKSGDHTLRVQRREDGVAIEQICLVRTTDEKTPLHATLKHNLSQNIRDIYKTVNNNPHFNDLIIIRAQDIPNSHIFGSWKKVRDPTANYNPIIKDMPDLGLKNENPLLHPANYFEAHFHAERGVDYHVWVRMKAENDSISSDSIYLQFDDSINRKAEPIYRIGDVGLRDKLKRIDLILAGHTHGGQVRFPIIGALNIVPDHKIRYDMGLFEEQGTKMYVNRGIGTTVLPTRFLCTPEITVFKFTKVEKSQEKHSSFL